MIPFTILGAAGFIGSCLVTHLNKQDVVCKTPSLAEALELDLGHVIYCIGLTADFRNRPWDTMDAHVSRLVELLRKGRFCSFLYLSSTRVYQHLPTDFEAKEDAVLTVDVHDPSDLYNLSKLAGESACLCHENQAVRIARLSNVYGPDLSSSNFLSMVIRDALNGSVEFHTALDSEKDYIHIDDVVDAVQRIALHGESRLYNVAGGRNVSNQEIANLLEDFTGCSVRVNAAAPEIKFPAISIQRMKEEFSFHPTDLGYRFYDLLDQFRKRLNA